MNKFLLQALAAALLPKQAAADPGPAVLPIKSEPDGSSRPLALEMQARSGRTLDSLHVEVVDLDHRHCPPPKRFNMIGDSLYIRREDAPALQEAILRRRKAPRECACGQTILYGAEHMNCPAITNQNKSETDDGTPES